MVPNFHLLLPTFPLRRMFHRLATDSKGREFRPFPSSRFLVNTHVKNSFFKFVFGSTNDFPLNASFPHNFIFLSNSCRGNYYVYRRELKSQFLTNSCQGNSHFPERNSQNVCFCPRNSMDILCFPGGKFKERMNSPSGNTSFLRSD